MKTVLPPIGEQAKNVCTHAKAGSRDHRCPTCKGILRRCCDSIVGYNHTTVCEAR